MKKTQNATDWLNRITEDQNIEDLDQIVDTPMNGFKRWFASRILNPYIKYGYYDRSTGKVRLGTDSAREAETIVTSAAAHTFTAPYDCYLIAGSSFNDTRNSTFTTVITLNGNAVTVIGIAGYSGAVDTIIIGGSAGGSNNRVDVFKGPIPMSTGDTVVFTDGAFVAADVRRSNFIYEVR